MFKRFMNMKFVQIFLAALLAAYIGLVRRTTRWHIDGVENFAALQDSQKGFIACAWHSRFLMTTAGLSKMKQRPHVLISRSRDGNLVAYTTKFLGFAVIRGSRKSRSADTHKRGTGALREMMKTLKNGDVIFMTPDGPRGPRMRMGEGPLRLAQFSGAPVLAYGLSTSRNKLFNSWDRFMLPLPFGRGKIIWAGPISVPRNASDADIEALRLKLENLLNSATQEADISVGNTPILPADIPVKLDS